MLGVLIGERLGLGAEALMFRVSRRTAESGAEGKKEVVRGNLGVRCRV